MNLENKIRNIVSGFTNEFLEDRQPHGMCFAICFPLQSLLKLYGFHFDLVKGDFIINGDPREHFWLEKDGLIIDPTASQFNCEHLFPEMDEIYIDEKPDHYPDSIIYS